MNTKTKKKNVKPLIWDKVYNNPRADRQQDHDMKKEKEDSTKSTLYDQRRMTFREFLRKCEFI